MQDRLNEFDQPISFPLSGWKPRQKPSREAIAGKLCRIEPLDPVNHANQLWQEFLSSPDANWTYLPYGPFTSFEEFNAWLSRECTGGDPLYYSVVEIASGLPLGVASYLRINPAHGVIEVGHIHFSPRLQRTAMATEAMYLMMSYVFDELGYRRYEWKCDALNQPSQKAALRLGFTFEGVFRNAVIYKGRNRDTAWYSIVDHEWPQIKQGFREWLSPDNFDEQGQQRRDLLSCLKSVKNTNTC